MAVCRRGNWPPIRRIKLRLHVSLSPWRLGDFIHAAQNGLCSATAMREGEKQANDLVSTDLASIEVQTV